MPIGFVPKLIDAIEQADKRLGPFREARQAFLKQYAGPYYGQAPTAASSTSGGPLPINTVFQVASILIPMLFGQRVKADVKPRPRTAGLLQDPEAYTRMEAFAKLFGLALDHIAAEIRYEQTERKIGLDALFGFGIARIGLRAGRPVEGWEELEGYLADVGQPFVSSVDLDDWFISPCRDRQEADYEGHHDSMPLEYLTDPASGCDQAVAGKLRAGREESAKSQRVDAMGKQSGDLAAPVEVYERVDVSRVWLPRERVILWLAGSGSGSKPLKEVEWDGPEEGPYETLAFHDLPSNVMPVAPVGIWYDLHKLINKLARKAGREAESTKNLVLYNETAESDAKRVRGARDGDTLPVKDARDFVQVTIGGVSDQLYQHLAWTKQILGEMAGNPSLAGGVAAESPTLGQDEMLMGRIGRRVGEMRKRLQDFRRGVYRRVGWYLMTDPTLELPVRLDVPGIGALNLVFNPDRAEGDILDYFFDVEPFTVSGADPESEYELIVKWMTEVILPLAPTAAEQGVFLDAALVGKITGGRLGIDEADRLFRRVPGLLPQQAADRQAAGPGTNETTNINLGGQAARRQQPREPGVPARTQGLASPAGG